MRFRLFSKWVLKFFKFYFLFLFFPLLSSSSSFAEEVRAGESQDIAAVRELGGHLKLVGEHARFRREWGGGLFLGLGAASAIGGIVTSFTGSGADVPVSLGVTAVLLGGIGVLIRISPADQETLSFQYPDISEGTPEEIRQKRVLGEAYLTIFGHQAKRNRLMSSALNIVLGTALLGWYASENQALYPIVNPFLFYEGIVLGGLGIVGLFVESDEEAALKNYDAFKNNSKNVLSTLKFGVSPLTTGGIARLSFSF